MLIPLLLFTLSSINVSAITTLKDGKYSNPQYGLEVHVEKGEAKTVKLDETIIPLTKNEDGTAFSGDMTDSGVKYSFIVTTNTKKSIYTTVTTERNVAKTSEDQLYNFKGTGFEFTASHGLITNVKTGVNKDTVSEIEVNMDGTIKHYNVTNTGNYSLDVEDNKIQKFECNSGCLYNIVGTDDNAIEISDSYNGLAYIKFSPNVVEFYKVDSGKQVTNTYDGTHVDIDTYFYDNSKSLLSTGIKFKVNKNDVTFTMTSDFVLKKSL